MKNLNLISSVMIPHSSALRCRQLHVSLSKAESGNFSQIHAIKFHQKWKLSLLHQHFWYRRSCGSDLCHNVTKRVNTFYVRSAMQSYHFFILFREVLYHTLLPRVSIKATPLLVYWLTFYSLEKFVFVVILCFRFESFHGYLYVFLAT